MTDWEQPGITTSNDIEVVKYVEELNKIPKPKGVHLKVYKTEEYIVYDSRKDMTIE